MSRTPDRSPSQFHFSERVAVYFTVIGSVNDENFDELMALASSTVHDTVVCWLKGMYKPTDQFSNFDILTGASLTIIISGLEVQLRVELSLRRKLDQDRLQHVLTQFLLGITENAWLNNDPVPEEQDAAFADTSRDDDLLIV